MTDGLSGHVSSTAERQSSRPERRADRTSAEIRDARASSARTSRQEMRAPEQSETSLREIARESDERLRLALEAGRMTSWDWDIPADRLAWWTPAGRTIETISMSELLRRVDDADRDRLASALSETLARGTDLIGAYRVTADDGSLIWVECHGRLYRSDIGEPALMRGVAVDITERKQAEEALRESEARYRAVVDTAFDAIISMDGDGVINSFNRGAERIFDYTAAEVIGKPLTLLMPDRFHQAHSDGLRRYLETGIGSIIGRTLALPGRRRDGSEIPLEMSITAVEDGANPLFTGILRDITQRKALEEQLFHQAFHDPLTNLPNRSLFAERLSHALSRATRTGGTVGVLFLDLDNFKVINDSLGHSAGDQLLVAVAARLRSCLRAQDTAARLGGDEFTVLLEDAQGTDDAVVVAERISRALDSPFALGWREVFITASIGIALSTSGGSQPEDLLRNADVVMYRAKHNGKARHEVFDPSMSANTLARLELESELRRAIARHEFLVYYQPKVRTETGDIVGVEALLRWQHPRRGIVSPIDFIPLAEETGLIVAIGDWVLREACAQMQEWHEQHPELPRLALSVNLSARQFQQPDLVERVAETLTETGLDPSTLSLEITEGVVMSEADDAGETLRRLKELGIRISVDDFGTGYSSLAYLKQLPVDTLKIDGSFMGGLADHEGDHAIVAAVINLSHALGLDVVAEGVESADQLGLLRRLGCDMAQGFYFSQPLNGGAMSVLLIDGLRPPALRAG